MGYSRECPRSLRVSEVPRCRQEVQNGADIVDARWMGAQAVLVEESCRRAMYAVAWPRMGAAARSSARARWSLSQVGRVGFEFVQGMLADCVALSITISSACSGGLRRCAAFNGGGK